MLIRISISVASLLALTVTLVKIEQIDIGKVIDKFILNIGGTVILNHDSKEDTSGEKAPADKSSADNCFTPRVLSGDKKPETTPASSEAVKGSMSQDDSILQNGIPNTGYLAAPHSTALRTFTLDYPGAVNIVFRPSDKDTASYKLTVRGASNAVLMQKNIDGESRSCNTGNLYLRAGTYRIEVARLYSWSGKPYTLTVNASHAVNTEEETNDTISTANVIPLNENIRASTGTRNDIDYFTFTLDKTASVCPHLEFEPVKNYSLKLYELVVEDINGTESERFIFRGDARTSKTVKPFILREGTYIIPLSRVEDKNIELGLHEYTLRVSAQELM